MKWKWKIRLWQWLPCIYLVSVILIGTFGCSFIYPYAGLMFCAGSICSSVFFLISELCKERWEKEIYNQMIETGNRIDSFLKQKDHYLDIMEGHKNPPGWH